MGIASMAIGAAQGLGNMISQSVQNRKNRKFQKDMYNQQKADNIKFWEMENQYNSPIMQMQRLKEAGLNPNLAYGQIGSGGGNISAPSQNVSDQKAPQMPDPSFLMDIYNMKKIDAQTDLTRQQIQNQIANERLTTITTALQSLAVTSKTTENEFLRKKLENEQTKLIADIGYTQQQTRTSLAVEDKTRQDIKNSLAEINMKAESQNWTIQQTAQNIAESVQRIAKMKTEQGLIRSNTKLSNLKAIEQKIINKFAKEGIRPGEHILSYGSKKAGIVLGDLFNDIIEMFK